MHPLLKKILDPPLHWSDKVKKPWCCRRLIASFTSVRFPNFRYSLKYSAQFTESSIELTCMLVYLRGAPTWRLENSITIRLFARFCGTLLPLIHSDHFICSMPALFLLFFFVTERTVLMVLLFYHKRMLEKITTQRTQQLSDFSFFLPKEQRTQLNAVYSQLLEKLRLSDFAEIYRFQTIQSLEFQESW